MVCCKIAMTNTEALMTWARERILRTKQKLKRTMISSADWPPPNLIYSSTCHVKTATYSGQHGKAKGLSLAEPGVHVCARRHSTGNVLSHTQNGHYANMHAAVVGGERIREDSGLFKHQKQAKMAKDRLNDMSKEDEDNDEEDDDTSYPWLVSCCWRDTSERRQSHRISSMLSGTYKTQQHGRHSGRHTAAAATQLMLKTGPDGSLICDNNVDINMLIAGFREFEKHLQYGALMPFVNVLPTPMTPTADEGEDRLEEAGEVSECSEQASVQLKSLCRTKSTPFKDKRVSFADLQTKDEV